MPKYEIGERISRRALYGFELTYVRWTGAAYELILMERSPGETVSALRRPIRFEIYRDGGHAWLLYLIRYAEHRKWRRARLLWVDPLRTGGPARKPAVSEDHLNSLLWIIVVGAEDGVVRGRRALYFDDTFAGELRKAVIELADVPLAAELLVGVGEERMSCDDMVRASSATFWLEAERER